MIKLIYRKEDRQVIHVTDATDQTYFNTNIYEVIECEEENLSSEMEAQGIKGIVTNEGGVFQISG